MKTLKGTEYDPDVVWRQRAIMKDLETWMKGDCVFCDTYYPDSGTGSCRLCPICCEVDHCLDIPGMSDALNGNLDGFEEVKAWFWRTFPLPEDENEETVLGDSNMSE